VTSDAGISSRSLTRMISTLGDCAVTTELATEQTGQICDPEGEPVISTQKWSCAPRRMTPRSKARNGRLDGLRSMYLIRRRLGWIGCGVKDLRGWAVLLGNHLALQGIYGGKVKCSSMRLARFIPSRMTARRALALLACAALLYFASGGTLLHRHAPGPDNVCHVCQALHMPALAAATLDPVATPEFITWYSSLREHAAPCESFDLHRASRAPPSA
jgi:hypothetical protein